MQLQRSWLRSVYTFEDINDMNGTFACAELELLPPWPCPGPLS